MQRVRSSTNYVRRVRFPVLLMLSQLRRLKMNWESGFRRSIASCFGTAVPYWQVSPEDFGESRRLARPQCCNKFSALRDDRLATCEQRCSLAQQNEPLPVGEAGIQLDKHVVSARFHNGPMEGNREFNKAADVFIAERCDLNLDGVV